MLHLLQQQFLLLHQMLQVSLCCLAFCHVLDSKQQHGVGVVELANLSGVDQHESPPQSRKVVLDLIGLHSAALGDDLFKQGLKSGNFPLTLSQFTQETALCVLESNVKGLVKGMAGRDD